MSCKLLKSILAGRALASLHIRRIVEYGLNKAYAGDIRYDTGRAFDYTYDIVTVGPSNTVRLGKEEIAEIFQGF